MTQPPSDPVKSAFQGTFGVIGALFAICCGIPVICFALQAIFGGIAAAFETIGGWF